MQHGRSGRLRLQTTSGVPDDPTYHRARCRALHTGDSDALKASDKRPRRHRPERQQWLRAFMTMEKPHQSNDAEELGMPSVAMNEYIANGSACVPLVPQYFPPIVHGLMRGTWMSTPPLRCQYILIDRRYSSQCYGDSCTGRSSTFDGELLMKWWTSRLSRSQVVEKHHISASRRRYSDNVASREKRLPRTPPSKSAVSCGYQNSECHSIAVDRSHIAR